MASQDGTDVVAALNEAKISPDEVSKSAAKKAEKQKRLAAEKANKSATNTLKETASASAKKATTKKTTKKDNEKALVGINVGKEEDFPNWYQQVLTKGDMLDYYNVSGCYILKPGSYHIWEEIQGYLNQQIKSIGVENCSFPMFVSQEVLEREKAHIEGFAAEVAWVTHAGKLDDPTSKLEQPIAIRPTSETVMYPYYAKWIRSHRDLPLRLNQWNSVVRWEFKHPMPFLRTREFLWQEGHCAYLTFEEAAKETRQILEYYAEVYEKLLAVPIVRGTKTEKERFAGGMYSTTCEGYIAATGRGIQGATSHCLGQNFSKMFGITVEDPSTKEGESKPPINVWQTSWGLSTRVIGVMVMTHGDDKGLVIPPRVARVQVIVIPAGITKDLSEAEKKSILDQVVAFETLLTGQGLRVRSDLNDKKTPGEKFSHWEMQGVPLRLEFGPGDMKNHCVTYARRDILGKEGKGTIPVTELSTGVPALLETIQADLYAKAKANFDAHRIKVTEWKDFVPALNAKNVVLIPHCLTEECEDQIKKLSARKDEDDNTPQDEKAPSMGAKSLCIPFEQPEGVVKGETPCTNPDCKNKAEQWCMFGRSY